MADRFESMAAFVKAADLKSFAAAAVTLGISAQTVGKHVATLEERLGTRLLSRSTRRQSLTPVGELYYQKCRAIPADLAAADEVAYSLSTTPKGLLRVGASIAFGSYCLAPIITGLLHRHKDLEVDLKLHDSFSDVVGNGYDVVIRLGSLTPSELKSRPLKPLSLVLVASPAYLERRGMPLTPAELSDHDCLGFAFGSGVSHDGWCFTKDGRTYGTRGRTRFRANDASALKTAALDGVGVVLHSDFIVQDDIEAGRPIRLLPKYSASKRESHILFPNGSSSSAKLRVFVEAVVKAFG